MSTPMIVYLARVSRVIGEIEEEELAAMLAQWVSELPPCVVRRNWDTLPGAGLMVGLAWADDPRSTVVVKTSPEYNRTIRRALAYLV